MQGRERWERFRGKIGLDSLLLEFAEDRRERRYVLLFNRKQRSEMGRKGGRWVCWLQVEVVEEGIRVTAQ